MKPTNFLLFCNEIERRLQSGMPVIDAFYDMCGSKNLLSIRANILRCIGELECGKQFQSVINQCMPKKQSYLFQTIEISIDPLTFISHVHRIIQKERELRHRIFSVVRYPLFLLIVSVLSIIFAFKSIIPSVLTHVNDHSTIGIRMIRLLYECISVMTVSDKLFICFIFFWGALGGVVYFRKKILETFQFEKVFCVWSMGVCLLDGKSLYHVLTRVQKLPKTSIYSGAFMSHLLEGRSLYESMSMLGFKSLKTYNSLSDTCIKNADHHIDESVRQLEQMIKFMQPILLGCVCMIILLLVYLTFVPLLTVMQDM